MTLLESEIPVHTHTYNVVAGEVGDLRPPANAALARTTAGGFLYFTPTTTTNLAFQALTPAGGSLPHNNMQPYLTLNFCIALQGVFPPRT